MKKTSLLFPLSLAMLVLSGCSTQTLHPMQEPVHVGEVCITPDSSNRKIAYNSTIQALKAKGFTVREVGVGGGADFDAVLSCNTVSRWDVANFTSEIHYQWFEKGVLKARADYQCKSGLNFTKYIDTQEKVNDMLNKMLPSTPQLPSRYSGQATNW